MPAERQVRLPIPGTMSTDQRMALHVLGPQEPYENYLLRMGDEQGARQLHHRREVVASLEPLSAHLQKHLGKREKQWFPDQFLDDPEKVRENAKNLSPLTVAVAVGNDVTEKGLPAYMAALNKASYPGDISGSDSTPSAKWVRGWTAQELEHEEFGYGWSLLSRRVNMHTFNILNYTLLINGFNPGTGNDPYNGYGYTTPQELATYISHDNLGKRAKEEGDMVLYESSQRIGPDEKRHFNYNFDMYGGIFDIDPDGATIVMDETMTRNGGMIMPGALSSENVAELAPGVVKTPFFEKFEIAAQKAGVYTIYDYIYIYDTLMKGWNVEGRTLKTKEAEDARKHLLRVREILGATAGRTFRRIQNLPEPDFSFLVKAA